MILKGELTGRRLKKDLGLHSAAQRWHNKNKSGGNFGINLIFDPRLECLNFELTGHYFPDGEISSLAFGELYQPGTKIYPATPYLHSLTYSGLIEIIKERIASIRQMEKLTEVS